MIAKRFARLPAALMVVYVNYCNAIVRTMRPKAREMTQHGGAPGWLEESDPAG